MDDEEVVRIIQDLTRADFDKSMTSISDHAVWQDVYKPTVFNHAIYVKFTIDEQKEFLLISFKGAT
jgi:motility quorum-sensing regulator / GCU-specific mRNA interferase toxin